MNDVISFNTRKLCRYKLDHKIYKYQVLLRNCKGVWIYYAWTNKCHASVMESIILLKLIQNIFLIL